MTPPASSSTDLDLGGFNRSVPLPPITPATPPVSAVRLNPNNNTTALASHVQNAAQSLVAPLGAIGGTFVGTNASFNGLLNLAQSIALLGGQLNAAIASVPGAIPATDSPSIGQQSGVMLCTSNFIGMLGLIGGTAAVLLRMAVLSGATTTSTTGKDKWRLVQILLFAVVILVVVAATGEAGLPSSSSIRVLPRKTIETPDASIGENGSSYPPDALPFSLSSFCSSVSDV